MRTVSLISSTSAAVSLNSTPYDLGDYLDYSIEVPITGSDIAGTLKLQCSNSGTNWFDVADTTTNITASADTMLAPQTAARYRYVRVSWTASSGTGNISALLIVKQPIITAVN